MLRVISERYFKNYSNKLDKPIQKILTLDEIDVLIGTIDKHFFSGLIYFEIPEINTVGVLIFKMNLILSYGLDIKKEHLEGGLDLTDWEIIKVSDEESCKNIPLNLYKRFSLYDAGLYVEDIDVKYKDYDYEKGAKFKLVNKRTNEIIEFYLRYHDGQNYIMFDDKIKPVVNQYKCYLKEYFIKFIMYGGVKSFIEF